MGKIARGALGFATAVLLCASAHGQTLIKSKDYGQLWVQPDVCEPGGAIQWRVMLGGKVPWESPLVVLPGTCLQITQPIWQAWTLGWFETRCAYTDGRAFGPWAVVSNVVTISGDGRCE